MAGVVPETAPFVRAAAISTPGLKNFPVPVTSVAMQMQRLVYGPLKSATNHGPIGSLGGRPFLIVIDGLDECEDKDEAEELVDSMLTFFDENPFIPLRVFITSRVEQHIQSRLDVPGVRLENLVDHCSDSDITAFLDVLFQDARRRNPVIKAYIRQHKEWPTPDEKRKLVEHIGGSFIFASAIFKFIMGYNTSSGDPTSPMDRLPLALKMNPGLDGLYTQTLARSEHLPHFLDIISTIALLRAPLPISGIAELLGIHTYEVVNVLMDLQAIFQVPGTDDIPVTLCHTSLRDFLTTQSRSNRFFAHPRHHVRLYLRFLECEYELRRQRPDVTIHSSEVTPAVAYYRRYSIDHLDHGRNLLEELEFESAIRLSRETLMLHRGSPELVDALADAIVARATALTSCTGLEEAISLYRESLLLRPSGDGGRWLSLYKLADALIEHHRSTRAMSDVEEAIDLCREALTLRPSPHPDSWIVLINLGKAVSCRYWCNGTMADLEEAISLDRQALELRPSPHPDCAFSLGNLSVGLRERYLRTKSMADLEEAISLDREALKLRPSPHPYRSTSLHHLAIRLGDRYRHTESMADLEEAISLDREALELRPSPHPHRSMSLNNLATSLRHRYQRTKAIPDLEEAISLHREALELPPSPSPHRHRSMSLNNLGISLYDLYQRTESVADLEEAISLYRQALELRPSPHPDRPDSLWELSISLQAMYKATGSLPHLQEAISRDVELLDSHHPVGHEDRVETLHRLASSVEMLSAAPGQEGENNMAPALPVDFLECIRLVYEEFTHNYPLRRTRISKGFTLSSNSFFPLCIA
jgi:tetratricopeptide (TPR) repeat protein